MDDFVDVVVAGRYALELELGRGGMATVWRARDLRHDRVVAIKILHPELAGVIGAERFLREVRLTARLQHQNIAAVLDSGVLPVTGGVALPWFAMAYLHGESLRARLAREGQLPIEDALRITEAVADALQEAHRHGVLHRDIKPENVLLTDGRTYVVDFGIAKAVLETGGERLTSTGLSIGTPAYMSPEQTSAGAIDARSDQYSLASMLYEMLTGDPPFLGNTQAIMARRFTEPARPMRTVRATVPDSVERAVLRALERIPADRFPDLVEFVHALRSPAALDSRPRSPRPGRRWYLALAGGILLAASLLIWLRFGAGPGLGRRQVDSEGLALYQRGLRAYDRRSASGTTEAVSAFNTAVKRDSGNALAWNGLAKAYVRAYERGFSIPGVPRDQLLPLALTAVNRALTADSGNADTWLTQALLSRNIDPTDDAPVLRSLRHAIALDSSDASAWHFLALALAETDNLNEALLSWHRSVTLDPSYTQGLVFLGIGYYWHRQYDSASVWADSAVALNPNYLLGRNTVGYIAIERGASERGVAAFEAGRRLSDDVEAVNSLAGVALAEARAGRRQEARANLGEAESEARAYAPVASHTALFFAQAYAALGDVDHAVTWLSRYHPRSSLHFQLHLRCDPPFDPIRAERRFRSLLTLPAPLPPRGC